MRTKLASGSDAARGHAHASDPKTDQARGTTNANNAPQRKISLYFPRFRDQHGRKLPLVCETMMIERWAAANQSIDHLEAVDKISILVLLSMG